MSLEITRNLLNDSETDPWQALSYMVPLCLFVLYFVSNRYVQWFDFMMMPLCVQLGEVTFGGHVTDRWDMRCTKALFNKYCGEQAQADNHKFTPSGLYCVPTAGPLDAYIEYISGLPAQDGSDVFGLHETADTASLTQESSDAIATIMALGGAAAGFGADKTTLQSVKHSSNDQIVASFLDDVLGQLPVSMDVPSRVTSPQPGESDDMAMSMFLAGEARRYNKLLAAITGGSKQLRRAVDGLELMTEVLDEVHAAITNNMLPMTWASVSYPSLQPLGSYITDLQDRLAFLQTWLTQGRPKHYWLSGIFFTHGFIAAILLSHSHESGIAVDTLAIKLTAQQLAHTEIAEAPKSGLIVYGMFLDGASFDWANSKLTDLALSMRSKCPLPPFHMEACALCTIMPDCANDYACPVYRTTVRKGTTNFVMPIKLPSDAPSDHWVLRGVASVLTP